MTDDADALAAAAALEQIVPLGDEPTERALELGEVVKMTDHPQPPPLPAMEDHEHVFRCLRCGAAPDNEQGGS